MSSLGVRSASLSFALSGLLFVLYPAFRPFSDEESLSGAAAFGSTAWVVAHSMAIVAFVLLILGMLGVYLVIQTTRGAAPALIALVMSWIGVGLTLPFYGAEVFALHAIGQQAIRENNPSLVGLASAVRGEPGIWFIISGLLLLAVGMVAFAVAIWRSRALVNWSGIPLAIGFVLYIPQFSWPQWLRVAHGFLITVACALLGWQLWRQPALLHQEVEPET